MPVQSQPLAVDAHEAGSLSALNDTFEIELNGITSVRVLTTGTWDGTIKFEQSVDGSRWDPAVTLDTFTGAVLTTAGVTTNTIVYILNVAAIFKLRAIFTAYTSGQANLVFHASSGINFASVMNFVPTYFKSSTFDAAGNALTSQASGGKRPLDTGIVVGGAQVDPRAIRTLTVADRVTAFQGDGWNIGSISGPVALPTGASTLAEQQAQTVLLDTIEADIRVSQPRKMQDGSGNPIGSTTGRLHTQSKILGDDGLYNADVVIKDNRKALVTDATVTVESVFGFDDFADTWFFILASGADTDTVTVSIAAGATDSSAPDRDPPAYSHVTTVTATEAGDEIKLRDKIIAELNADSLFSAHWKASSIKDNAGVHVSSKYIGEFGERLGPTDFQVTATGTTVVSFQNSDNAQILRRGKQNSGIRDPRDKRLVTFGISGEVQAVPGAVGDLFIQNALNAGSPSMLVNGTLGSPIIFEINPPSDKDAFVEEVRFYGNANGIKFGQFLGQNNALVNGILVEIRSDGLVTQLPIIKLTDDFKHKFAFGVGAGFQLHVQAGRDDFMAALKFSSTFPLRKQGTFPSGDDYVRIYIRDNLQPGIQLLEFLAIGFEKEV